MLKQYKVTGMSCAACSSRVEKAVNKVPGVESCGDRRRKAENYADKCF